MDAIPWFDPLSGGIHAGILLLLEAPGPMASRILTEGGRRRRAASGFVSPDNDDETARNTFNLLRESHVPRDAVLIWNIVPWYVGSGEKIRSVTRRDIQQASPWLRDLLDLLPALDVVVLIGRKAQAGWATFASEHPRSITTIAAPHPSPLSLNRSKTARTEIREALESALRRIRPS